MYLVDLDVIYNQFRNLIFNMQSFFHLVVCASSRWSKQKRRSEIAISFSSRLRQNYRVSLFLRPSYIVIDCAISRPHGGGREKGRTATRKSSREIDGGGWHGMAGLEWIGQGEKGRAREKEREFSLSSEKSRESNESGATGVFAASIYTSTPP